MIKKLNVRGFSHHMVIAVLAVVMVLGFAGQTVMSHAMTPPPDSTSKVSCSVTTSVSSVQAGKSVTGTATFVNNGSSKLTFNPTVSVGISDGQGHGKGGSGAHTVAVNAHSKTNLGLGTAGTGTTDKGGKVIFDITHSPTGMHCSKTVPIIAASSSTATATTTTSGAKYACKIYTSVQTVKAGQKVAATAQFVNNTASSVTMHPTVSQSISDGAGHGRGGSGAQTVTIPARGKVNVSMGSFTTRTGDKGGKIGYDIAHNTSGMHCSKYVPIQ